MVGFDLRRGEIGGPSLGVGRLPGEVPVGVQPDGGEEKAEPEDNQPLDRALLSDVFSLCVFCGHAKCLLRRPPQY